MPQVKIQQRFIHQSPRKLRLVSDLIRGLPAKAALVELSLLKQTASQTLKKALTSAIAAAAGKQMNTDELYIGEIMVDEGPKMRRYITMSRGRSERILKRMSHVKIILTDEALKLKSTKAYKRELQGGEAKKADRPTSKTRSSNGS